LISAPPASGDDQSPLDCSPLEIRPAQNQRNVPESSKSAPSPSSPTAVVSIESQHYRPPMEIRPSDELEFELFSQQPFCSFTVRNDSGKVARAFRIRVSDHASYSVKPSRGLLRPRESVAVTVRLAPAKRKDVLSSGNFVCSDKLSLESAVVDQGFVDEYYKDRETLESIHQCRRSLLQDVWLEPMTQIIKQPLKMKLVAPRPYEVPVKRAGSSLWSWFKQDKIQTYKPMIVFPAPLVASMYEETASSGSCWPLRCKPRPFTLINCSSNFMAYRFEQPSGSNSGRLEARIEPSDGILSPHMSVDLNVILVPSQLVDDEDILSATGGVQGSEEDVYINLVSTPVQDPALLETLMQSGDQGAVRRMSASYLEMRIWEPASPDDIWVEAIRCEMETKKDRQPTRRKNGHVFFREGDSESPAQRKPTRRFAMIRQLGCLFHHCLKPAPMTPVHME